MFIDNIPLEFGKYQGKTPNEIAVIDPQYIVWLYDNLDEKFVTQKLRDECEAMHELEWDSEKEFDNLYGFDGW